MTKVDENIKSAQNLLSGIVERCHELEEENKKLKYVIDSVMEKEGIEYIRTSYGDVFLHPQNGYHILDDSINKGQ